MKIICGTDFAIHAAGAANVAAAWATRSHAPLKLVHALESSGLEYLSRPQVDHLRGKLGRKLVTEGDRLRATGAEVMESLVLGRAHEVLVAAAKQWQAELIVVSSLGWISPVQMLAGSVAERTAQSSTVPTLVVRDQKPLVKWAMQERPLNVFVGYDFSASSAAALRWVASLARLGPLNVTVTHLFWPPSENWRLGAGDDPAADAGSIQIHNMLKRDLAVRCAEMMDGIKVTLQVVSSWGNQDTQLIDLAKAGGADLIVVGTNQRRGLSRFWLGSVSRGVLHHAATNVVCVPMAADFEGHHRSIPAIKRVLVPTDFSKCGNQAVAFAYGILPCGGELSLLHVAPPVASFQAGAKGANGQQTKRNQELTARLQALIPEGAHERGIQSRAEVVEYFHPATAICQAAERANADLICIGSRGHRGLKKKLLGSVTESVMKRSKRPVLVVRR
jgi:nucleotide-binding universal stress UspA family protein